MNRNGKPWMRKCKSCGYRRPIEKFALNKRGKHRTRCKLCSHV